MFQSLFLWKYVSGPRRPRVRSCLYMRFNPCFCGSTSQVGVVFYIAISYKVFQSLFLWKYVSGRHCLLPRWVWQSVSILVFVEVRLRSRFLPSTFLLFSCFNPCFCGSTSQVINKLILTGSALKFQSLFLWKYVSGV